MRKLLQNSLFAAMTAWALHGVQAQIESHPQSAQTSLTLVAYGLR